MHVRLFVEANCAQCEQSWEFAGVSCAQAREAVKLDVDLVTSCGDTLSHNHDTHT